MTNGSDNSSGIDRRSYLAVSGGALSTSLVGCLGNDISGTGTRLEVPRVVGYGGVVLATNARSALIATQDAESEPNDTRANATPISTGVDVNGHLDAGEVDWYAFDATDGATLTVGITKETASGVASLVIYDTAGEFVDEVYISSNTTITRDFIAPETGTYFVQIVDIETGEDSYVLRVDSSADTAAPTTTATPTATPTPSPTPTPTPTPEDIDYGVQGYGEHSYGGID